MQNSDRARLLMDLLEGAGEREVPTSALKAQREGKGLSQSALSRRSGVGQQLISMIESGERSLTPDVAGKLAPILGTGPRELMKGEEIAALKRWALKGQLDPRLVLETALELDAEGSGDANEAILDALLNVLRDALERYEGAHVATKSRREAEAPTRDHLGRRIDKPYGRK